jgi:hypothetical protein
VEGYSSSRLYKMFNGSEWKLIEWFSTEAILSRLEGRLIAWLHPGE